jgi:cytochrome c oxidase cbb3-type subunit I
MYGFIAFIAWGAVYGLLAAPDRTRAEPAGGGRPLLARAGRRLTYVSAISVAGVPQGFAWVGGQSFIASVIAAEPMWLWRTVGGLLMVASHVVFAVNVWAMRPQPAAAPTMAAAAVRSPA